MDAVIDQIRAEGKSEVSADTIQLSLVASAYSRTPTLSIRRRRQTIQSLLTIALQIEVLTYINAPRHPCPAFLPSLDGRDPSGDIVPQSSLDVANHWERSAPHESVVGTVARIIGDALSRRRSVNGPDVDAYEGMGRMVTRPRWRFGWRA